jgi:hypothetical protein
MTVPKVKVQLEAFAYEVEFEDGGTVAIVDLSLLTGVGVASGNVRWNPKSPANALLERLVGKRFLVTFEEINQYKRLRWKTPDGKQHEKHCETETEARDVAIKLSFKKCHEIYLVSPDGTVFERIDDDT